MLLPPSDLPTVSSRPPPSRLAHRRPHRSRDPAPRENRPANQRQQVLKLIEHLNAANPAGANGIISPGGAHPITCTHWPPPVNALVSPPWDLLRCPQDTLTVKDLQALGMQLHWLGYGGYRARHEPGFWQPWQAQYPDLYPVPEGGGGLRGARGCITR